MTETFQRQGSTQKEISDNEREQFWRSHLKLWVSSGLSQAAYCRENGLNIARFGYWKRRFGRENLPMEFVQIPTDPVKPTRLFRNNGTPSLRVTTDSEFSIEVLDGFSPATLEQVLLTLKRI